MWPTSSLENVTHFYFLGGSFGKKLMITGKIPVFIIKQSVKQQGKH